MRSASGRFTITFNGEVYNYKKIRAELEAAHRAPPWVGSSDTEVMLAAIEAWGLVAAIERFVGMFAFALWDEQERALHLVRDRLGVKPLYWSQGTFGLAFASELKALRQVPGFVTELDPVAVEGYVRSSCVSGEASVYRGTRRLLPGTIATFSRQSAPPRVTKYWDAVGIAQRGLESPFTSPEADLLDEGEALLKDAVGLRMVADVPIGAFLSGGIDSSLVVALMQAQSSRPVRTFSIENERAGWNEGPMARAVAEKLGTQHTAELVTAQQALDVIPLLPSMFDEPFADSSQIPTFLVSRMARKHVTVSLSGDGGDELFGGYTRHIWGPRVWRLMQGLPNAARGLVSKLITSRTVNQWDALLTRLPPPLPTPRIPGIRLHKVATALAANSPAALYRLLTQPGVAGENILNTPLAQSSDEPLLRGGTVAEEFMLRDLLGYLPDDILTKVDRASMAVSLEAREPLLDHRLVEFAARLPLRMKVRGQTGKWFLRTILARHLPPEIISGPKMGFAVPLGDWLRGPLREWAESLLTEQRLRDGGWFDASAVRARWTEHLSGRRNWESALWNVLMFEAWRAQG